MYMKRSSSNKLLTTLLSLILVISIAFPMELSQVVGQYLFAQAAMTVGGSGVLVPGTPQCAVSGIAPGVTFRNPPIRVSLYRNKNALLNENKGLTNIYNIMKKGYPQNLTASIHFIKPETASYIGDTPISIGSANTSDKTLTYVADADAISNIVTMNTDTPNVINGVYYSDMKAAGIEAYKVNWRNRLVGYEYSSQTAWSWILTKSDGDYLVDARIKELFGGTDEMGGKLDYNDVQSWTQNESTDAYLRYLDMLMTLYTVSSGNAQALWGQAVDDYLASDNLTESPISICIDSEALMTFDYKSYLILIPSIDYLNFATGIEKSFAISDEIWWATPKLADENPGNSYDQLLLSAKESVFNSPGFKRISDYYTDKNGFSFAATAFTTGVLRTPMGGTPYWTSPDSVLSDYFNIFRLYDPDNPGDKLMRGYMLSPAPNKLPSLSIGVLKADPDNKVIETDTIGMPVTLTVTSGTKSEDHGSWDTTILNAEAEGKLFDVSFTFSRTSSDVNQIPFISPNPAEFRWSPTEMSDFIYGRRDYVTTDDTSSISTGGLKSITFNYTLNTVIKLVDRQWTGTSTDPASFKIIAPRIGYTSKPEAFSELKNYGSKSTLDGELHEDWDAMAGVPSTEQLYFAAGGSEFIVDITVERIEDEVAKRSYQSYYNPIDCEFKAGDTAKPVNFPEPTGAGVSGSTTWDPHSDGSFTITWNGTIPNLATAVTEHGMGHVTATCPAQPDRTAYDAAKAAAQAYVGSVNGTTFSWTAQSDGKLRSKTAWGASITTDSSPNPITTTASASAHHTETSGDPPESHTVDDPCSATAYPGPTTNYQISVTWYIPAHTICGPCCSHILPEINDTWAQTWKYDAMKIVDVHIWKIDQAAVNGLTKIISTDVVGASIVKGEPNIFYNIALKQDPNFTLADGRGEATGTSMAGRLRYSLNPAQHDEVAYNNGTRTNKCDGLSTTYGANVLPAGGKGHAEVYSTGMTYESFRPGSSTSGSTTNQGHLIFPTNTDGYLEAHTDIKDKDTLEYAKFLTQRTTKMTPTVLTDFLILQTSNGDQAVMYFHKSAPSAVNAESEMPQLDIDTLEMWDNNGNSASKWKDDHINIGSYNGKFSAPGAKFRWANQGSKAATIIDPDPAGTIIRPIRHSGLMLYTGALNNIMKNTNKSYISGKAEVFWANSLHWTDTTSERFLTVADPLTTAPFPTTMTVGKTGFNFQTKAHYTPYGPPIGGYIIDAPYSKEHTKINNIIIHDPFSVQDVSLISLPDERDQRASGTLGTAVTSIDTINDSQVCLRDPALCDFRVLNCTFSVDTVLADFDFSTLDGEGNPKNKTTGNSLVLPTGFSLAGGGLNAQGLRAALPFSELDIQYQSSTHLRVEADVLMSPPTGNGTMLFSFNKYALYIPAGQTLATLNTGNSVERRITKPIADGVMHHIVVEFSFNSVDSCKVTVDGASGYSRIAESADLSSEIVGSSLYIGCWGSSDNYPANFYLDNLKITRLAGTADHNAECYKLMTVHPDGLNSHVHSASCLEGKIDTGGNSTGSQTFNYTGSYQEFIAPEDGKYTLDVWGAQGGDEFWSYTATGGLGGHSKGDVTLKKDQKIYVYIGGEGTDGSTSTYSSPGGWNGGGNAYYGGAGGGGTDIRTILGSLNSRVIVAGGGGGANSVGGTQGEANGGTGGGDTGGYGGTTSNWGYSGYTSGGGTQSAGGTNTTGWNGGGSLGQGGTYNASYIGGGGGGYYGGASGAYHGGAGAGGSGYTAELENITKQSGVNTGNGKATISWNIESQYNNGVDWIIAGIKDGTITEQKAKDILGNAYDPVMSNSFGPVIHTWDNWTTGNMYGFSPLNQVVLAATEGNLVQTSSGTDPYFNVPVRFDATGVGQIEVTLDNKTTSTQALMMWERQDASGYNTTRTATAMMQPNSDNQVVKFVVRGNTAWEGTISSLRFDLATTTGITNVKSIRVYGAGTLESAGSGNSTGIVVWEGGTAGTYAYNAAAGSYKVEVWGASGGTNGGGGAYANGTLTFGQSQNVNVNVGGIGQFTAGGVNGGGSAGGGTAYGHPYGGGGATDIRINGSSMANRVLIAGGGGGGQDFTAMGYTGYQNLGVGGHAGGTGSAGTGLYWCCGGPGEGATQSNGGAGGGVWSNATSSGGAGSLGQGGNGSSNTYEGGAGGGGGYYGGGGGAGGCGGPAGGGGSSYVGGVLGGTAIAGNATIPGKSGGVTTGNIGDGYAKITALLDIVVISGGSSGSGMTEGTVMNYGYTGSIQQVTIGAGTYKLETWGAEGGRTLYNVSSNYGMPGKGGYSGGNITINGDKTVSIYVGGAGGAGDNGGYNGGGKGLSSDTGSTSTGGGATDLRINSTNLSDRVIVAGGGGGTEHDGQPSSARSGAGGGTTGGVGLGNAGGYDTCAGNGGTQSAGGTIGTQASGGFPGSSGQGGNSGSYHSGGGGGGYYGGASGNTNGGGGGGSGYIGGVTGGSTISSTSTMPSTSGGTQIGQSGNGYARITALSVTPKIIISKDDILANWDKIPANLPDGTLNPIWGCDHTPNIHVHNNHCVDVPVLQCTEPHHKGMHYDVSSKICWKACYNDANHKNYKPIINTASGSFKPGNFLNLDYNFQVYYPNIGDFENGQPHGISALTSQRGLGFKNNLDTTRWTRTKRIKFEYNVIYEGKLYLTGEWIQLADRGTYSGTPESKYDETKWSNYGTELYNNISKDKFDFYCVLANREAKSASIKVAGEAVNCPGPNDNKTKTTNKARGKFTALHGAAKTTYADIVGRIGNLIIEDTGDYRFSNFFKTPLTNSTIPTTVVYGTTSGLIAIGNASVGGGRVTTIEMGSEACVRDTDVTQGFYRIDIAGNALNNGHLKITTNNGEDWSGATYVSNVTFRTSKMSYHLSVPKDTKLNVSWVANNSTAMAVKNIGITKFGDSSENWIVEGVVRTVDESNQNFYMTWSKDIRGLTISSDTNYVNTYDTLNWIDSNRVQAPVSAEKNNISVLRDKPLLVGYPLYFDISSLGNYLRNNSGSIQVVPYYYALDTTTKEVIPLDAYFKYASTYQPVNIHGLATSSWTGEGVYNFVITLDWLGESVRRNYTDIEKSQTDFFREYYAEGKTIKEIGTEESGDVSMIVYKSPKQLDGPGGSSYILGNGQLLKATGKARTFIGGETTYGELMNLGGSNTITEDSMGRKRNEEGRLPYYLWWQEAQRWHLKLGVPSSTVFVKSGETPDSVNVKEFDTEKHVILLTADIRVIGDTYVLRYQHTTDNGSVNIQRTDGSLSGEIQLPNNIPPILAVYSTTKSSTYDVEIIGRH